MSPSITGSPLTSTMLLRATPGRPPVIAVPQTASPLRASTPSTSPEAKGMTASWPSIAGLAPPSSPVPPTPCTRQSVSPVRASSAKAVSSRCTTTTRPPATAGAARIGASSVRRQSVPPVAGIEGEDLAEAGGDEEDAARTRRSRRPARRRPTWPSGTTLRVQATCPLRVTAVTRPAASIAKTRPPATMGPVSTRVRLSSPAPMSTDQISCGTGRSAGLTSRPRAAPLRWLHSAFTTGAGIPSPCRGAAGDGRVLGAHRECARRAGPGPCWRSRPAPRRRSAPTRARDGPATRASATRASAVGRHGRRRGQRPARGDDQLPRPAAQRLAGLRFGEHVPAGRRSRRPCRRLRDASAPAAPAPAAGTARRD